MDQQALIAIIIFIASYALIISEKIHRTIVAMIGGILMVLLGIVDQETAIHHIDFNTIGLLIGMMIIVGITADSGVFRYLAIWSAKKAKADPMRVLLILFVMTAVGSAFLDNVTTVLLMAPVTLSVTRRLQVPPVPYLISQIIASNIGGTATMIGDPPNIMIGSAVKELSFLDFIVHLAPIAVVILLVTGAIFWLMYRKKLSTSDELKQEVMELDERAEITDRRLLVRSLIILGLTLVGFFLHQSLHLESATVALAGAFLLLLRSGENQLERSLEKTEWTTLFFFVGLFVLVAGLIETGVIGDLAKGAMKLTGGNLAGTSMLVLWMSAIASAFVDNIPFVATMIPMIQEMGTQGVSNLEPVWWSLALGACLGGNGSLVGASANLIVAGLAAKEDHPITFVRFLKIGFPLMLLSVLLASGYVWLRYLL